MSLNKHQEEYLARVAASAFAEEQARRAAERKRKVKSFFTIARKIIVGIVTLGGALVAAVWAVVQILDRFGYLK